MNIFSFPTEFNCFCSFISWAFNTGLGFVALAFLLNFLFSGLNKIVHYLTHCGGGRV